MPLKLSSKSFGERKRKRTSPCPLECNKKAVYRESSKDSGKICGRIETNAVLQTLMHLSGSLNSRPAASYVGGFSGSQSLKVVPTGSTQFVQDILGGDRTGAGCLFFFFPFTIFIFSSYKNLTWLVENLENTNNKNEKKNTHL